jgi:hypothetical protein
MLSTPFCPCLLLNLSPMTGLRLKLILMLARCASPDLSPTSVTCAGRTDEHMVNDQDVQQEGRHYTPAAVDASKP